jgi:hypothetical protein
MSFAALKSRVNASVLRHLADAEVLIGGVTVQGIFRNPSVVASLGDGAADTRPTVSVASGVVPDDPADQVIEIDGVPYSILYDAPDGSGMTLLTLERVQ